MPERVRVLNENGIATTAGADFARAYGLNILDGRVAVDSFGRDLPPKRHTTGKSGKPTAKTAAKKTADTTRSKQ